MKKVILLSLTALTISFTSCRDKKETSEVETEVETIIEEAKENGSEIDVSEEGDKIKIESPDGDETKIKMDEDGIKIKTDDNN